MNISFHSESHIFLMDINEICVSPARIWPSLAVSGSFVNENLHSLVDIMLPPFRSTTVIGSFKCWLFIGVCWFDIISDISSILYSYFRLYYY